MKCNILSWNVRGLNCINKRLMVRNLLRQLMVDIVCRRPSWISFLGGLSTACGAAPMLIIAMWRLVGPLGAFF